MPFIDVALTRAGIADLRASVCIVIDCVRAGTVVANALTAGYERVLCVREVALARRIGKELGDGAVLGGERGGQRIEGFALGNSPGEYRQPLGHTLILCTTNGTAALVESTPVAPLVLFGALVNLQAVTGAATACGHRDVAIVCAGVSGGFALDDAYVAGRYVRALGERADLDLSDSARAATALAQAYPSALRALELSRSGVAVQAIGLGEDVCECAAESSLMVAPRVQAVGPDRVELIAS